jgi:MbtH protein
MATNPFEDPDAMYLVLVNDEGQHSLWPVFADVPEGWEAIFGEAGRQECLEFIEKNWADMRPKSLIKAMEADAVSRQNGVPVGQNGMAARQNGGTKNTAAAKKQNGTGASKKEAVAKK